jgi:hypothetical protein
MGSDLIGELTLQRSEAPLAEFPHSHSCYTCSLHFLKGRFPATYFCDNDERMRVTSSYMTPLVSFTSVKMELQACTFITRKLTLHGVCRKRLIKGVILWSTDNMGPLVFHFRGQDDLP